MISIKFLKRGYKDVLNILFPRFCLSCGCILLESEHDICHRCLSGLQLTGFDYRGENPVYEKLSAIVNVERATALFLFNKYGVIQKLIHNLKYENHPEIGVFFAKSAKNYLSNPGFFSGVDYIVPVPLHPKKQHKRGYNQMTEFGKHLEKFFNVPYSEKILIRQKHTESQTRKNALQRRENVKNAFRVLNPERYTGKHFVIIDDVITTGATVEACTETILNQIPHSKVSILAMTMVL